MLRVYRVVVLEFRAWARICLTILTGCQKKDCENAKLETRNFHTLLYGY